MMRIDPQTGYAEASGRSPRFNLWAAFFVFSIITLGSAVQVVRTIIYIFFAMFSDVFSFLFPILKF